MGLSVGTRLGPYEIVGRLGAGGMGEVYRARDTRLERAVAVKVLPEHLSADAQARDRFDREAHVISGLSHPNICALYDVGEHDARRYLVLEYLEGESLADRLRKGPLPVQEALKVASEIACALSTAHRHGVIHRDLKPANVMLTRTGAKLLDFGLARPSAKLAVGTGASVSGEAATVSKSLTEQGTIIGTFQYMAPEQLEGREADARSDIFSFGALLYELITGRAVFRGASRASIIGAIMAAEPPPMSSIQPLAPAALDRLVRECLAKDPDQRRQTAHDVLLDLKWIAESLSAAAPVARRTRNIPLWIAWALLAAFVLGIAVAATWWRTDHPVRIPAAFVVSLPQGFQVAGGLSPTIAISPDSRLLAYVATEGGHSRIYIRAMDQLDGTALSGTEGADGLFFSPDGRWIGFFAGHKLEKIAVQGGGAVTICDAGAPLGASWGADDQIIFAAIPDAGLLRVVASGGKPQVVIAPDYTKAESDYFWPEALPDGRNLLFTTLSTLGKSRIDALNLRTGRRHSVVDEGMNAHYSAGHLVFSRGSALFAAPFDLATAQLSGTPFPALDGVAPTSIGASHFSLSRDGTLIYISGGSPQIERALVWVDRTGASQPLPARLRAYQDPRISPDGKRVVVEIYSGAEGDLWTYDTERGTLTRITFEGFENETPVWIAGGERIAFSSSRTGLRPTIYEKSTATGKDHQLLRRTQHVHLTSASADGGFLAFTEYDAGTQGDIWVWPLDGASPPHPFLQTPFHEWGAVFSPDSRWIAYVSNESGRDEVYLQAFPGPSEKRQVSTDGGSEPLWARTGRELFYRDGRKLLAVPISTSPEFKVGRPRPLFEAAYDLGLPLGHTNYDVTADGQRFLMIQTRQPESASKHINVRQDWVRQFDHPKLSLRSMTTAVGSPPSSTTY